MTFHEKILPKKKFEQLSVIIQLIIFGCFAFLLVNRIKYGIDFSDEGWYVAEPYIVSRGGHIPFVNLWSQAPGVSLPLATIFRFFSLINGGTEGIFYFSRVVYVIWLAAIGLIIAYLMPYLRIESKMIFPITGAIVFTTLSYSLFDMTYNTIGLVYLMLSVIMLFKNEKIATLKDGFLPFCGGFIGARALIATPTILPSILICIILAVFIRGKKRIIHYLCGMMMAGLLFFAFVLISGKNVKDVINGLYYLIRDFSYFKIPQMATSMANIRYLLLFLVPAITFFFLELSTVILGKKNHNIAPIIPTVILVLTISFFTIGILVQNVVKWTWFGAIGILINHVMCQKKIEDYRLLPISAVSIAYFITYVFSSWTNIYGFGSREYWLMIPTCMTAIAVCMNIKKIVVQQTALALVISFLVLCKMKDTYEYVYRDAQIEELNTKINRGIWRGLYTTEERAEEVITLEETIRGMTKNMESVLFLDWVSFAYIMTDARMCSPTSLDPCSYTYNTNYPEIMYDYFSAQGEIPQSIIYIDYGRDALLSIDNEGWRFNEFVNGFYKSERVYESSLFKVREYCLVEGKGLEAMEYCEQNKTKALLK